MSVVHLESDPVLGFVERGSFDHDREARLLGLLPKPVTVPAMMVSTNYSGDRALCDPFSEPWRFKARPRPARR